MVVFALFFAHFFERMKGQSSKKVFPSLSLSLFCCDERILLLLLLYYNLLLRAIVLLLRALVSKIKRRMRVGVEFFFDV